ncbi:MAG: hypothetical protein NZL83_03165 [Candidatus Absconditabacterales bacterium]|nr:hypothetical protein [Candidatus Absconditabacterales bacterium]
MPNFFQHVAQDVVNEQETADAQGRVERLYQWNVNKDLSLRENIMALFYPSAGGGQIWGIARIIAYGLLVLIFVYNGILFIFDADDEGKALGTIKNLIFVGMGATLFFGAIRIIDVGIGMTNLEGSAEVVKKVENVIIKNIFGFCKAFAFFFGIIMLIWHGYQMMQTVSQEEKIDQAKNGALNVVIAMTFVKAIDYIYFIAQLPNFKERATETIINIAKIMAWVMGFFFLVMMIYAGLRLVVDGGKGEGFGLFKKTAYGVFLGTIIFFLFLLVSYQIVQEFA